VVFDGRDVAALTSAERRALRRRRQMVYQNPYASLDPRFSISWVPARVESYFALLQGNVLDRLRWTTARNRLAIITWIERTYHHRRRRLGRLTPIEYETLNLAATAA
jgi:ABC-type glutathione transport system ATPase component